MGILQGAHQYRLLRIPGVETHVGEVLSVRTETEVLPVTGRYRTALPAAQDHDHPILMGAGQTDHELQRLPLLAAGIGYREQRLGGHRHIVIRHCHTGAVPRRGRHRITCPGSDHGLNHAIRLVHLIIFRCHGEVHRPTRANGHRPGARCPSTGKAAALRHAHRHRQAGSRGRTGRQGEGHVASLGNSRATGNAHRWLYR